MPLRRFSGCMGSSPDIDQHLTIGVCTEPMEGLPNHWILMLTDADAEYATCYHPLGGPSRRRPWELVIESGERRSWDVDRFSYVSKISVRHARQVKASAKKIPSKKIARDVEEDPYADASPIVEEHEGFRDQMFDWVEKHCLSRLGSPRR
ncbi:uncharacterized protein FTJAE_12003 [Fusarium tjaetaba]|uniref:Uncharacterized protein n=1 Tax=Fusarium tjaetaba TaxID=1567544 RepID=A0A8H5VEB5_9HYPO|nr:uncharacterized protein FTJAE_12003 [Fusarium tjaetaba]KAF5619233.1 hypothetical protein FTJAE_12003 [Fusarium tjaetaba]